MVLSHYRRRQLCCGPMAMPVEAREDLDRALTATIFGVMQRMKQDSARKAADWDMSVAQVRALYALRDPLSMRELAERLYLDPSNLTALVDRLEDLGLVERQADADDRRVKRLVITEKGVHLSEEIIDAVFAESTVFEALDADEKRQLLRLLDKLVESPTTLRSERRGRQVSRPGRRRSGRRLPGGGRAAFGDDPRHRRAGRHRDRPDEGVTPADTAGRGIRRRVFVTGRPPRRGGDRPYRGRRRGSRAERDDSPHDLLHGDHVPTAGR